MRHWDPTIFPFSCSSFSSMCFTAYVADVETVLRRAYEQKRGCVLIGEAKQEKMRRRAAPECKFAGKVSCGLLTLLLASFRIIFC